MVTALSLRLRASKGIGTIKDIFIMKAQRKFTITYLMMVSPVGLHLIAPLYRPIVYLKQDKTIHKARIKTDRQQELACLPREFRLSRGLKLTNKKEGPYRERSSNLHLLPKLQTPGTPKVQEIGIWTVSVPLSFKALPTLINTLSQINSLPPSVILSKTRLIISCISLCRSNYQRESF